MFIDDIEINDMHIRIAEILLDIIHSRQENIITYKELSIKLDREVYEEQLGGYLGALSDCCLKLGLPQISAMVVNGQSYMPGRGFFKYYYPCAKEKDYIDIFVGCCHKIKAAELSGEWIKLEEMLNIDRRI